jgi:hypothetical protein
MHCLSDDKENIGIGPNLKNLITYGILYKGQPILFIVKGVISELGM